MKSGRGLLSTAALVFLLTSLSACAHGPAAAPSGNLSGTTTTTTQQNRLDKDNTKVAAIDDDSDGTTHAASLPTSRMRSRSTRDTSRTVERPSSGPHR